jgi:hypothetical protein
MRAWFRRNEWAEHVLIALVLAALFAPAIGMLLR